MTVTAYPLSWPVGWRRTTAARRDRAKFGKRGQSTYGTWQAKNALTIAQAVGRVREQFRMMGIDAEDVVISTNLVLRLDGLPRSNQGEPADPGVAVYWEDRYLRSQPPRCMAIDCYDRVADNLAAIAATLDAMRAIERHGGAVVLERAFAGFAALPAPVALSWRDVLDPADPEGSYRRLRSQHHPDHSGDPALFDQVQRAYQAWQQEARL